MKRCSAILGTLAAAVCLPLALSCPTANDPAPPPAYHVSFKLDGVLVELGAGPSGTANAEPSGTIAFEGLPSAFQVGTAALTRILASETAADIGVSTTYQNAADRLRIDFKAVATGDYALNDGTNGMMRYESDKGTDGITASGTLHVTSFGLVGEDIVGTFDATLTDSVPTLYAVTEGSFRVKRYPAILAGS